ncbi:MAG: hypothetical protein AAFQ58_19275 [Pseudomonadota bacterium]
MEAAETIKALGDFVAEVGFFETVVIGLLVLGAGTIVLGKYRRGDSAKQVVQDVVTPVTCAWGDMERSSLSELRKDVDVIRDKITKLEGRLLR